MTVGELARAKVNLTLTVRGRRPDGYHALESLVTFADAADRVTLAPGGAASVAVTGPFAAAIDGQNLLDRTLALLRAADPGLQVGAVALEKNLPVAAGLGGGSADAAALLRAVARANPGRALPLHDLAARLGADVAVCLADAPALMWGIGDKVTPLAHAAATPLAAVLANPRQPLATPQVFQALSAGPAPAEAPPATPGPFPDLDGLLAFMRSRGNDLEPPALALLPAIAEVKAALLAQPACRYAALSGSGPTCFGIFTAEADAARAAAAIAAAKPGWWVAATRLDRPV